MHEFIKNIKIIFKSKNKINILVHELKINKTNYKIKSNYTTKIIKTRFNHINETVSNLLRKF